MRIKHGAHAGEVDQRGRDTWLHYHEGRAERVVMEAPGQRLIWERRERESDPISLARRYLDGADLVLVEGFAAQPLPKIETYRLACGQEPLYDPARPDAELWVAMITHNSPHRAAFPVFRFSDTAWPMTLANIALGPAPVLDP